VGSTGIGEEERRLGNTTEIQEPYAKNAVGKSRGERAEGKMKENRGDCVE